MEDLFPGLARENFWKFYIFSCESSSPHPEIVYKKLKPSKIVSKLVHINAHILSWRLL